MEDQNPSHEATAATAGSPKPPAPHPEPSADGIQVQGTKPTETSSPSLQHASHRSLPPVLSLPQWENSLREYSPTYNWNGGISIPKDDGSIKLRVGLSAVMFKWKDDTRDASASHFFPKMKPNTILSARGIVSVEDKMLSQCRGPWIIEFQYRQGVQEIPPSTAFVLLQRDLGKGKWGMICDLESQFMVLLAKNNTLYGLLLPQLKMVPVPPAPSTNTTRTDTSAKRSLDHKHKAEEPKRRHTEHSQSSNPHNLHVTPPSTHGLSPPGALDPNDPRLAHFKPDVSAPYARKQLMAYNARRNPKSGTLALQQVADTISAEMQGRLNSAVTMAMESMAGFQKTQLMVTIVRLRQCKKSLASQLVDLKANTKTNPDNLELKKQHKEMAWVLSMLKNTAWLSFPSAPHIVSDLQSKLRQWGMFM